MVDTSSSLRPRLHPYSVHRRTVLAAHRRAGGTLPYYGGEITDSLIGEGRLAKGKDGKGLAATTIQASGLGELEEPLAAPEVRGGVSAKRTYGVRLDEVLGALEIAAFDPGEWLQLAIASLEVAGIPAEGVRRVRELLGRLGHEVPR